MVILSTTDLEIRNCKLSVSETYSQQQGMAYNGHFECLCYLSKARAEQDRHQAREVFGRVPPGLFSLLAAGDTLSGRVEVYPQPDQQSLS